MTVGVAAKSVHGRAIVVMTDRLFTFGDHELKGEEPIGKAMWTANGWLAAYAGDPTLAEAAIATAHTRWNALPESDRPTFQIGMLKHFHTALLDEMDTAIERNVLRRRGLDMDTWREKSVLEGFDEGLRAEVVNEFDLYDRDRGCELLLCGFDPIGDGHVLTVSRDDQQHEHEWAAIGSGGDIARGRLIWQRTHSQDALARTLYEVYEATAHASMNPGVGEQIAAWVLTKNWGLTLVPDPIMKALDGVFRAYDQTPFMLTRRDGDYVPSLTPPDKWEETLGEWAESVIKHPRWDPETKSVIWDA